MFINCPHCRALVATDPATDRAPPYCPICSAAIEPVASAPVINADDRSALRHDASRRLEQMLSSLDDQPTPAPPDIAPTTDPTADASPTPADHTAPDTDDAGDAIGRIRVRPPGPAPIDVIRSPVDAIPEAALTLPPAAEMLEQRPATGIAGFLRRLGGARVAMDDAAAGTDRASIGDTSIADSAVATDIHTVADTAIDAATVTDADASSRAATASPVVGDTPTDIDPESPFVGHAPADIDPDAAHDASIDAPDDLAVDGTEPPPLRPALVRPVDRPRVELAPDPLAATSLAASPADDINPPSAAVPLPVLPVPLVATLPIGVPTTRAAPSFVRRGARARDRIGVASVATITVLAVTLVLQLLLADRAALAADARWRPAMTSLCGVLRCTLPPWREPTALAMIDRDVRPDPARPGVLRVTATFRNDARWPQPWPRLALTLSDVEGAPLATRDFSPREYLGAAPTQGTLAPGQSASIAMDLVEPDARSVAFDFELH